MSVAARAVGLAMAAALGGCAQMTAPGGAASAQPAASAPSDAGLSGWVNGLLGRDRPRIDRLGPAYQPSALAVGDALDVASKQVHGLGLVELPVMQRFANDVLGRLKQASGVAGVPGSVYLLAKDELEAVSTPDGNIFVSVGWLLAIQSEDELAALLSHELAHVLLNHHGTDAVGLVQKQAHGALSLTLAVKKELDKRYGATPLAPSGEQALRRMQLAIDLNDGALSPAWTRGQESEADQLGMDILLRAGYAKTGFVDLLATIADWEARQEEVRKANEAQVQAELQDKALAGDVRKVLEQAFSALKDMLRSWLAKRHASAEQRQDGLSQYLDRFHAELPRVAKKEASWQAVMGHAQARPVLEAYKAAFDAERLLQQRRFDDAAQRLRALLREGGPISRHALPNANMYLALRVQGRTSEAETFLRRSFQAPEPAWKPYRFAGEASIEHRNLLALEAVVMDARQRFHGTPALLPPLIALYREAGQKQRVDELLVQCRLVHVVFKAACEASAQER